MAAYVLLHWISNIYALPIFGVTPWNPENGLTFLFALQNGARGVPFVLLASIAGDWIATPELHWTVAVIRALLLSSTYTVSTRIYGHISVNGSLSSVASLLKLLLAAAAAAAVYAFPLAAVIGWLNSAALSQTFLAIATSMTGDIIGIITIAPLMAMDHTALMESKSNRRIIAGGFCGIAAACLIAFGRTGADQLQLSYLVLVPVVVCALLLGFEGAALSVAATDFCMMVVLYFQGASQSTAIELQLLMVTLSATGLLLGSIVSERRRLTQEIMDSHQRLTDSQNILMQASRLFLLNEMASAISHEISQPLSSIRNYARTARILLGKEPVDTVKLARLLDSAVVQIDLAGKIVSEARKFVSRDNDDNASASVRQCAELCLRLLRGDIRRCGCDVVVKVPPQLQVLMPEAKLQQILLNLVRNAVEAVRDSKQPSVQIIGKRKSDGNVQIRVIDTGVGMTDEEREKAFIPFSTAKAGGLGLGLPLSQRIARSYGGELWIEATRPGYTELGLSLELAEQ